MTNEMLAKREARARLKFACEMKKTFASLCDERMARFWSNVAANYEAMLAVMTPDEQRMTWRDYRARHLRCERDGRVKAAAAGSDRCC